MVVAQCEFGGVVWNMVVDCAEDAFDEEMFKKLFDVELSSQDAVMKILDPSRMGIEFSDAETAMKRAFRDMGLGATDAQFVKVNLD